MILFLYYEYEELDFVELYTMLFLSHIVHRRSQIVVDKIFGQIFYRLNITQCHDGVPLAVRQGLLADKNFIKENKQGQKENAVFAKRTPRFDGW